jgi:tRNA (guanine-N(7)-)-methyltransferase
MRRSTSKAPLGAAPTILEIGFGMGEATAHIAALMPEKNFLCCEVHTPGRGRAAQAHCEQGLANIRILQHDAVEVMDDMLPPASLDGVHIFFPDPWHKKKHNKRRLIQAPLIAKLAARLKPGGYLHCATDWQPYAEQILEVLAPSPCCATRPTRSQGGYAPKPAYRPLTKFENRGIKLGTVSGTWCSPVCKLPAGPDVSKTPRLGPTAMPTRAGSAPVASACRRATGPPSLTSWWNAFPPSRAKSGCSACRTAWWPMNSAKPSRRAPLPRPHARVLLPRAGRRTPHAL